MKLLLADNEGNVLDSMDLSRKDFDEAQMNLYAAQSILRSLRAGDAEKFGECAVCGSTLEEAGLKYCSDSCEAEDEKPSGSSYFNEAGEPLMTAQQANFEAYLDEQSAAESYLDRDDFGPDYQEGCEI